MKSYLKEEIVTQSVKVIMRQFSNARWTRVLERKKSYVERLGNPIYFNTKIVIFFLISYCYNGKSKNRVAKACHGVT